jgi:hypothetical protein
VLNNHGANLAGVGRHEEALLTYEESVNVSRELAAQNSDSFLLVLASSLTNMGIKLRELGRSEEGLRASEEATEICRQLARHRPESYLLIRWSSISATIRFSEKRFDCRGGF